MTSLSPIALCIDIDNLEAPLTLGDVKEVEDTSNLVHSKLQSRSGRHLFMFLFIQRVFDQGLPHSHG
jgi:hypothetical protein